MLKCDFNKAAMHGQSPVNLKCTFWNTFLKNTENLRFSDISRGYKNVTLHINGLKR